MAGGDGLRRGNNIAMIALSILSENDYYGYQIVQLINEYSNGIISLTEGSLYPALYRLEDKGFVSSERRQVGRRLSRIYYHIEPSGKEYLSVLLEEYWLLNTGIQNILERHTLGEEENKNE